MIYEITYYDEAWDCHNTKEISADSTDDARRLFEETEGQPIACIEEIGLEAPCACTMAKTRQEQEL